MARAGSSPLPALVLAAAGLAAGCVAADRDGERGSWDERADAGADVGETVRYECDGGGIVIVTYPTDSTAVVRYDEQSLNLGRAVAASGARYVGDGFEWWARGRGVGAEGTLSRTDGADAAREPLETCRESSALEPGSAPQV